MASSENLSGSFVEDDGANWNPTLFVSFARLFKRSSDTSDVSLLSHGGKALSEMQKCDGHLSHNDRPESGISFLRTSVSEYRAGCRNIATLSTRGTSLNELELQINYTLNDTEAK